MQPRKHNRYRLDAPVSFFWRDEREIQHEGTGLTRDIGLGEYSSSLRLVRP